jgi:hypothetical protein
MAKEEDEKTPKQKRMHKELIATFATFVTAAFGFVAALAWNEAVKAAINRYIEPGSGLKSQFIYAIFVTVLAVLVSYYLSRAAADEKD